MAATKTNRRVYSAEELHRLRGTTSQPRLREAIEEHDGEDAELVKAYFDDLGMEKENTPDRYHQCWVDDLVNTPKVDSFSLTPPSPTEHVLRGSKSFAARSWKSRASTANSLRIPSNTSNKENRSTNASDNDRPGSLQPPKITPVLGEIVSNNQVLRPTNPGPWKPGRSPTPSLRKKKIESLVKAHGSPTHVRVTAGGRIVPSEQSPLCHPRYGYSAIKVNGGLIKFAPNHPVGKAQPLQWTQATQNGFVAQDVDGRLCQIVNGTILPLHETDAGLQLYMPAPNLNITGGMPPAGPAPGPNQFGPVSNTPPQRASSRITPPDPPITSQINALELEYSKLEHELKDIDKTEVLHGRTMGKGAKDALIAKRRELVVALDSIRKALKSLREVAASSQSPSSAGATAPSKQSVSPPRNRLPPFLQARQNQQMAVPPPVAFNQFVPPPPVATFSGSFGFPPAAPSPDFGAPWTMPPVFMPPPPPAAFDGSMSSTNLPFPPAQQVTPEAVVGNNGSTESAELPPQHDGARSIADFRRPSPHTHAVPIRKPVKSTLNPMSPVYKPGRMPQLTGQNKDASEKLSPSTQLVPGAAATLRSPEATTTPCKKSALIHSSSTSSFQTADFFPNNPSAYSTRHTGRQSTMDDLSDKENVPQTPKPPAAPPASPVAEADAVPDRSQNVSPKNRLVTNPLSIQAGQYPSIDLSGKSEEFIAGFQAAARVTSLSSLGSTGARNFSPLEWKSMSSVAQYIGLAHGENTTTPPKTQLPPSSSPEKLPKASPARAKFEHIAEMVGIKVTGTSPSKQRRWRDVWRASANKEGSKDASC